MEMQQIDHLLLYFVLFSMTNGPGVRCVKRCVAAAVRDLCHDKQVYGLPGTWRVTANLVSKQRRRLMLNDSGGGSEQSTPFPCQQRTTRDHLKVTKA